MKSLECSREVEQMVKEAGFLKSKNPNLYSNLPATAANSRTHLLTDGGYHEGIARLSEYASALFRCIKRVEYLHDFRPIFSCWSNGHSTTYRVELLPGCTAGWWPALISEALRSARLCTAADRLYRQIWRYGYLQM